MNYEYEVLSIHDVDFVKDGERIKGTQLWVGCPSKDPKWYGYEVSKIWIKDGHALEASVLALRHGDRISVGYNRHGKPEAIDLIA